MEWKQQFFGNMLRFDKTNISSPHHSSSIYWLGKTMQQTRLKAGMKMMMMMPRLPYTILEKSNRENKICSCRRRTNCISIVCWKNNEFHFLCKFSGQKRGFSSFQQMQNWEIGLTWALCAFCKKSPNYLKSSNSISFILIS